MGLKNQFELRQVNHNTTSPSIIYFYVVTRFHLPLNNSLVSTFLVFMLLYREYYFQISLSYRHFKKICGEVDASCSFSSGSNQRYTLANRRAFFKNVVVMTRCLRANENSQSNIVGQFDFLTG